LWRVFGARREIADFVHFTIPVSAVAAYWTSREFHLSASRCSGARFRTLLRLLAPFTLGFFVPLIVFITPYWLSGATSSLVRGVFHEGYAHIAGMGSVLKPPDPMLFTILGITLIVLLCGNGRKTRWLVGLALAAVLAGSFRNAPLSRVIWTSAVVLPPVVTVAGLVLLFSRDRGARHRTINPQAQQRIMLLISVAATCSLVQFPFAAPVYFCYFAPLLVLATAAVIEGCGLFQHNAAPTLLLVFYMLFAAMRVTPSHVYATWNTAFPAAPEPKQLQLARAGGLRVAPESADLYDQLVPFLQERAHGGSIIATANCAELYFLTGLPNHAGNDYYADPEQLSAAIADRDLKAIVLNTRQVFAANAVPASVPAAIAATFPDSKSFGPFQVYWRSDQPMVAPR